MTHHEEVVDLPNKIPERQKAEDTSETGPKTQRDYSKGSVLNSPVLTAALDQNAQSTPQVKHLTRNLETKKKLLRNLITNKK